MKKVLFFILSILYLTTSTGADLHYHYCMGNLVNWSIWISKEDKKCGKCGMEKEENANNGCCKDEHKWVKIEDDQKANFLLGAPIFATTETNHLPGCIILRPNNPFNLIPQSNAPPRKGDIAVFILNRNFRI